MLVGPIFGKFISSVTKCDVAPELIMSLCSFRQVGCWVHLLDFVFGIVSIECIIFIDSVYSSSSLFSLDCSGVQ